MPTLILTPRFTDDSQALWRAASRLSWSVERLSSWRIPDNLRATPEPVLYGEALFGPALAEQLGLTLLSPAEDWLVRLPQEYKLRQITMQTLGQARLNPAPAFVKPPNDKSFPASVYCGHELPGEFDDAMPVLVSDVVQWAAEFRCFILDRTLQTASVYSRFGELQHEQGFVSSSEENSELKAFVQRLLDDQRVDLPEAIVLDVGKLVDGGWACVELNGAWGAGIYGCDPMAVLPVLARASRKLAGA